MARQPGNLAKSSIGPRILSSVILAPPTLAAVWYGTPYFEVLLVIVSGLLAWEWSKLCHQQSPSLNVLLIAAVTLLSLLTAILGKWELAIVIVIGGSLAIYAVLFRLARVQAVWMGVGAVYIALPSLALLWLRTESVTGRELVIWLLAAVWATDIGAFAFGRTIGGPRLATSISPNKTWSGLIGGVCCAGGIGAAFTEILAAPGILVMAIISGSVGVIAQIGDLIESKIKRHFNVKDSSGLIPGHGGFFDRVDGLLFAAPAAVLVAVYLAQGTT